jgi:hypothetical protein
MEYTVPTDARTFCDAKKLKSLCITPTSISSQQKKGSKRTEMVDPEYDEIEVLVAAVRQAVRQQKL